jgi:hypothetical protein
MRLLGFVVLLASALLLWTSPTGSARNHVGWIFLLAGMVIVIWLLRKRRG